MTHSLPLCPECSSELTYEMGTLFVCPMCGHEWTTDGPTDDVSEPAQVVTDAVGNILADGDTVVVTNGVKVKGSAQGIKAGTKIRGIRIIEPVNGHDIDCKVEGFGAMLLKSSLVKKI